MAREAAELREKVAKLEGELEEARASYLDQHKTYEAHVQLLKNQLATAEGDRERHLELERQRCQDELAVKSGEVKLLRSERMLSEHRAL